MLDLPDQVESALVQGGGHGAEQFGEVGAALGATDPLRDLFLEALADFQADQALVDSSDLRAIRCWRVLGHGLEVVNHELQVGRQTHVHLMHGGTGRNHFVVGIMIMILGVQQVAVDIDQAIVAQIARTGDLASVQALPVRFARCAVLHLAHFTHLATSGEQRHSNCRRACRAPSASRSNRTQSERPTNSRWISLAPP
ncbi:hypothetical protein D3C84_825210 [compost metagenome]